LNPSVAIVILNWNGRAYLEKYLPGVMASGYPNSRVVLADNASTDDSLAFLETAYPSVEIIRLSQNFGFAQGYNEALARVKADYYVLLNSDVAVTPGWIEPVIAMMEADKSIAACQPKILMEAHHQFFEYAGAAGGWLDALGYPFARGRVFDICEADLGQYDAAAEIFWASGAAMFMRASLYFECGGLDPYFFAHQEEIDLCWRLQRAGYKIMACPASVVYHVGGGTLPKGNERKVFLNFRNNLIMLAKNLPVEQLLWKLPMRYMLDAISAWKTLLGGESHYFKAIIRAHGSFLYWVLFAQKPAGSDLPRRVVLKGLYRGSVIWKYFIRGKTKFSEIVGNNAG
jgi:hypothetical protein